MRIVILTYESLYSNMQTERLLKEFPEQVVGIVRSDCLIYRKSLAAGLLHLVRRTGLRFVGRKALELFQSRATAIAPPIELGSSRLWSMFTSPTRVPIMPKAGA